MIALPRFAAVPDRTRRPHGLAGLATVCAFALLVASVACGPYEPGPTPGVDMSRDDDRPPAGDGTRTAREAMVHAQIEARGVGDPRVLEAMRRVPRHLFVPEALRAFAYEDRPLGIGHRQTISQPYIVALMSELAEVEPGSRVLEVGTGSGYQAAVLAELGADVYSIEIVEPLAEEARAVLERLGYGDRVHVRHGDGYAGWPEHAPFDAIVITAAPPRIPAPLDEQLAVGGRMVVPVGEFWQDLIVRRRTPDGYEERKVLPVRFVPMTGRAQEEPAP